MSDLLEGYVLPARALSMAVAEQIGEHLLRILQPSALQHVEPVDVLRLVDTVLQQHGVDVYPVDDADLPEEHAVTDPGLRPDGSTEIRLRQSEWDALLRGGAKAHHSKATVAHEIAHAATHVPCIRECMKTESTEALLARREQRRDLKAYRDPEWQAWAIAGCLLMPRRTLVTLAVIDPWSVAEAYDVSPALAAAHMRRLKIGKEAAT